MTKPDYPDCATVHTVGLIVLNEKQELLLLAEQRPRQPTKWKLFSENVLTLASTIQTAKRMAKRQLRVHVPDNAFEEFDVTAKREFPGKVFELHPVVVQVERKQLKTEKLLTVQWFDRDDIERIQMPPDHKELVQQLLV